MVWLVGGAVVLVCHGVACRILKDEGLCRHQLVRDTCEELLAGHIRSPYLLSLLVDIYRELGTVELLQKAVEVRKSLCVCVCVCVFNMICVCVCMC